MGVAFILTAGRSGSAGLHVKLKIAENAVVLHEPPGTQALIDAAVQARLRGWEVPKEQVWQYWRGDGIQQVIDSGKIYVEATPAIAGFADVLPELYPDLKFIWLFRKDNRFYVRSAVHVGFEWCNPTKICAYWREYNELILRAYRKVPKQNRRMIHTESLNDINTIEALYNWLGLEPFDEETKKFLKVPFYSHKYQGPLWFPHPDDWIDEEYEPYNEHVLPLQTKMERMYERECL